mmetsp:Transcript_39668/g.101386  ORF Transcript_39668/g.101386 Transcript_39668/m.101386 type:complete len:367 (+) Transcript_39668:118-1218(+)
MSAPVQAPAPVAAPVAAAPAGEAGAAPAAQAPRGPGTGRRFDAELTPGKLFVGGLDPRTSQDTLVDYCAAWGALSDSVIMPGRGFGFITFADNEAAEKFLVHKDHIVDGKRIEAKRAVPRPNQGGGGGGRGGGGGGGGGQQPTHKLFVGGTGELPDDEFRQHFEQYGELEDAVVVRNPQGASRGFGFVTFKSLEDSERCFHADHLLQGRRVELKRAVPKGELYSRAGAGGTGGMKDNDWRCASCGNVNFAWRERCNRCQEDRPYSARNNAMRGGGGDMGGMGGGMGQMGGMGGYDPNMMGGMGQMGAMGGMDPSMGGMGGMGAMSGGGMGMPGAGGMGQPAPGGGMYGRAQGGNTRGNGAQRFRPY